MLGKIDGTKKKATEAEMVDSITTNDMSLNKLGEMVKNRNPWHATVHGVTESDTTSQLINNRNVAMKAYNRDSTWL